MSFSKKDHRKSELNCFHDSFYRDTHLYCESLFSRKEPIESTGFKRNYSKNNTKVDFILDAVIRKNNKKLEAIFVANSRLNSSIKGKLPQISRSQSISRAKKNTIGTTFEDEVVDDVILSQNFWKNVNNSVEQEVKNQPVIEYDNFEPNRNFAYEKTIENKRSEITENNKTINNTINTKNNNMPISVDQTSQNKQKYESSNDVQPYEAFMQEKNRALKHAYQKDKYKPMFWKYNLEFYRQPQSDMRSGWRDKNLNGKTPLFNRVYLVESSYGKRQRKASSNSSIKQKPMDRVYSSAVISSGMQSESLPMGHSKICELEKYDVSMVEPHSKSKISRFEKNASTINNQNCTPYKNNTDLTNQKDTETCINMNQNYDIKGRARSLYIDDKKSFTNQQEQESLIEINDFKKTNAKNLQHARHESAIDSLLKGSQRSKINLNNENYKSHKRLNESMKNKSIESMESQTAIPPDKFGNFTFKSHLQSQQQDYIATMEMISDKFQVQQKKKKILSRRQFRTIEDSKKIFERKKQAREANKIALSQPKPQNQNLERIIENSILKLNNSSTSYE